MNYSNSTSFCCGFRLFLSCPFLPISFFFPHPTILFVLFMFIFLHPHYFHHFIYILNCSLNPITFLSFFYFFYLLTSFCCTLMFRSLLNACASSTAKERRRDREYNLTIKRDKDECSLSKERGIHFMKAGSIKVIVLAVDTSLMFDKS